MRERYAFLLQAPVDREIDRLLRVHVTVVVRIAEVERRLEDETGFAILLEVGAVETRLGLASMASRMIAGTIASFDSRVS
jgi:hypothetical protein